MVKPLRKICLIEDSCCKDKEAVKFFKENYNSPKVKFRFFRLNEQNLAESSKP
jgi:hypothetical protein